MQEESGSCHAGLYQLMRSRQAGLPLTYLSGPGHRESHLCSLLFINLKLMLFAHSHLFKKKNNLY